MEELRKTHNEAKRSLIEAVTREGNSVLDVGCGFGGDLRGGVAGFDRLELQLAAE